MAIWGYLAGLAAKQESMNQPLSSQKGHTFVTTVSRLRQLLRHVTIGGNSSICTGSNANTTCQQAKWSDLFTVAYRFSHYEKINK